GAHAVSKMEMHLARELSHAAEKVYTEPGEAVAELRLDRSDGIKEGGEGRKLLHPLIDGGVRGPGGPKVPVALGACHRRRVVVAFRGSMPPLDALRDLNHTLQVLRDWVVGNFNFKLVKHDAFDGMVSAGFTTLNDWMWDDVLRLTKAHLGQGKKKVYLTGHS